MTKTLTALEAAQDFINSNGQVKAQDVFPPGTKVIWCNNGSDIPSTIIADLGTAPDGERYYQIHQNHETEVFPSGVRESQLMIDDDGIDDDFKTPEQLQAQQADQAAKQSQGKSLSATLIISAIDAVGSICADLDRNQRLEMLKPLAALVGNLPENERDSVESALLSILKLKDDVEWFMLQCPPPFGTPRFKPLSMADLIVMPPKQWMINQMFGRGDLVMIYGAPGCGKTFVTIDMIFSLCLGAQFARRFDVGRPFNVAYCAGEGLSGLPERFAAAAEYHGASDIANFTFFAAVPQLYENKDDDDDSIANNIRGFIREWAQRENDGDAEKLDVLVLDTFHSATAGADENSAKDMGVALKLAKEATHVLGCAVILIHHTNKSGSAERGSSSLRGAMDCMIEIRRISDNDTGTKAVMHCAKLKDGEAWKDQTFDLVVSGESVRVFWDDVADGVFTSKSAEHKKTIAAFMLSQPKKKFTAKILAEVAGVSQPQAIKLLSKMVHDGECIAEMMDMSKPNSNRNPLTYKANLPYADSLP